MCHAMCWPVPFQHFHSEEEIGEGLLSAFNDQLSHDHFKMETFRTTCRLIQLGAFMASIDLEDACCSVPIHPPQRRYPRFFWNNILYQYTRLLNGLAPAPRLLTTLLKPVYAYVHSRALLSIVYLDDSFLLGATCSKCSTSSPLSIFFRA